MATFPASVIVRAELNSTEELTSAFALIVPEFCIEVLLKAIFLSDKEVRFIIPLLVTEVLLLNIESFTFNVPLLFKDELSEI